MTNAVTLTFRRMKTLYSYMQISTVRCELLLAVDITNLLIPNRRLALRFLVIIREALKPLDSIILRDLDRELDIALCILMSGLFCNTSQ